MSDARPARDGSEKPAFSLTPSVTLPKGGGAIQGIDEKHAVSAATGSASASVGLGLSPGRNMSPSLGISYDAGNGNGPFGLGWSLPGGVHA